MTIEEAIPKAAEALKKGVHQNWVALALMTDGIDPDNVPIVIRWAQQINLKKTSSQ